MSFESPLALALGLTIPAIVLLWVLRPRRPRWRVPSLLLWPGSPAERQAARPWQRLRQRPLLWLQVLAAALLALAAARPFVPATAAGRHLVVLLDATGSMRARDPAGGSRFDAATSAVRDLARDLGPNRDLTLIRVDARPRALVVRAESAAEVNAALAGQEPGYGNADVAAALALATGVAPGPGEWVLVSDGGLGLPPGARRPAGTSFRFVPVGAPAGNVAVAGLAARSGDDGLTLQAEVKNLGPATARGSLRLLAEGKLVGVQPWQAAPGASAYLTWSHLPPGPRWYEADLADVDPAANALASDDRAWVARPVPAPSSILLVSDGNSFLERLLGVYGDLRPFRAAPADWPALASRGPAYALTVLDQLWPESPPPGNLLLVGPPVGAAFHPSQVWLRTDQPLLRDVDWSDVQIATARKLPLDSSWETVIGSDGGPLLAIREDDSGGAPRREAALAFRLGDSDLPLRPAFPVLMANLLDWLLPRLEDMPRTIAPDGQLALDPMPLAQRAWAEDSAGQRVDLAPPWPPRPFQPPAPGLYRIVQEGGNARQETLVVAAGYDPTEADLTSRTLDLSAADGLPVVARAALDYWPYLAGSILLLGSIEWWIDARGA